MCDTFLNARPLQITLGTLLASVAGPAFFLEQFVNALDDALQRLIHV